MWLCSLVDVQEGNYWKLSEQLFKKPFDWTVPNDDNRAFDGRQLRERFCDEMHIDYRMENFPVEVSMFEMLIGLAYRCEDIMRGHEDKCMEMVCWFWKMIENCGLYVYTDDAYEIEFNDIKVEEILDKIINRTYTKNGRGGLFPLKHSVKDQRKVEIWYQMNTYLNDIYFS